MDKWSRPAYAIGRRNVYITAEWAPELDRADDVVAEWKRQGFEEVLAASRLTRQENLGASDGSQRGKNFIYGWVMHTYDFEYSSSGEVRS